MEGKRKRSFVTPFAVGESSTPDTETGTPLKRSHFSSGPDSGERLNSESLSQRTRRGIESTFKRFKVTPSSATSQDFKLCNPFVRVDRRNPEVWEHENVNKFSFGKVHVDTLKSFFAWGPGRMIRRNLQVFQNTSGEELKYRAVLSQLFPAFSMISKKFKVLELKGHNAEQRLEESDSLSMEESSQSPFFNQVYHEYGNALDGRQSVDYALMTFPKKKVENIIKSAQLWGDDYEETLRNALVDLQNWKCVAVMDGKDSALSKMWLSRYAYQVGLYGTKLMQDTLEKGYVRPSYMLCISDEHWRLAMLDAFGLIEVTDNNITQDSFNVFEKHQNMRFEWFEKKRASPLVKKVPFTYEKLKSIFDHNNQEFRNLGHRGVPDGKYVVGFYYIDHTSYTWEGSLESLNSRDPTSVGTLHLMEGLLRLLVGEAVCGWSKEHVKKVLKEAEKEEEDWCERIEK